MSILFVTLSLLRDVRHVMALDLAHALSSAVARCETPVTPPHNTHHQCDRRPTDCLTLCCTLDWSSPRALYCVEYHYNARPSPDTNHALHELTGSYVIAYIQPEIFCRTRLSVAEPSLCNRCFPYGSLRHDLVVPLGSKWFPSRKPQPCPRSAECLRRDPSATPMNIEGTPQYAYSLLMHVGHRSCSLTSWEQVCCLHRWGTQTPAARCTIAKTWPHVDIAQISDRVSVSCFVRLRRRLSAPWISRQRRSLYPACIRGRGSMFARSCGASCLQTRRLPSILLAPSRTGGAVSSSSIHVN